MCLSVSSVCGVEQGAAQAHIDPEQVLGNSLMQLYNKLIKEWPMIPQGE